MRDLKSCNAIVDYAVDVHGSRPKCCAGVHIIAATFIADLALDLVSFGQSRQSVDQKGAAGLAVLIFVCFCKLC